MTAVAPRGVIGRGPGPARPAAPGVDLTLRGPAFEWALWSTTIRVAAHDPHHLPSARRVVEGVLAAVERERLTQERERLTQERERPTQERERLTQEPDGTLLAWTADLAARAVAADLGIGVLVSLGGHVATAGPGRWNVLVQDRPDDPASLVRLPAGVAIATAGSPDGSLSVTVVADSCSEAQYLARAAAETADPVGTLTGFGASARMVDDLGRVWHVGGWPPDAEVAAAHAEFGAGHPLGAGRTQPTSTRT